MNALSEATVKRLILYKRILEKISYEGIRNIFSHELATFTGGSAAQVRKDIMDIGYFGTSSKGYIVDELRNKISQILDSPEGVKIAIIGVDNLGLALFEYIYWHFNNLANLFAFDVDNKKVNEKVLNCIIDSIDNLPAVVKNEGIKIAILSVPMDKAKEYSRKAILSGIKAIINFTSTHLLLPKQIYVENLDIIQSLEKLSYYTRENIFVNKLGGFDV